MRQQSSSVGAGTPPPPLPPPEVAEDSVEDGDEVEVKRRKLVKRSESDFVMRPHWWAANGSAPPAFSANN